MTTTDTENYDHPAPWMFFEDHGPGVIFDHGSRTADELSADIVRLALEYGWSRPAGPGGSPRDALERYERGEEWVADDVLTVSEALGYDADDAIEYLSDLLPDDYYAANDGYAGAFGIWEVGDDE